MRFHGVRAELIAAQASALGLGLVQARTHPDDFETVFLRALEELRAEGVGGMVFGNIHLADVRAWYEERTTARGFEHVEPLWGEDPRKLVAEFIARGWRTRIVAVNLELGRREWLGRELDDSLVAELSRWPGVDLAGEKGEYHSFVFDGPGFREPLALEITDEWEMEGHAGVEVGIVRS